MKKKAHPVREDQNVRGNTSAAAEEEEAKLQSVIMSRCCYIWGVLWRIALTVSKKKQIQLNSWGIIIKDINSFHFQISKWVHWLYLFIDTWIVKLLLHNKHEPPWALASIQINKNESLVPVNEDWQRVLTNQSGGRGTCCLLRLFMEVIKQQKRTIEVVKAALVT